MLHNPYTVSPLANDSFESERDPTELPRTLFNISVDRLTKGGREAQSKLVEFLREKGSDTKNVLSESRKVVSDTKQAVSDIVAPVVEPIRKFVSEKSAELSQKIDERREHRFEAKRLEVMDKLVGWMSPEARELFGEVLFEGLEAEKRATLAEEAKNGHKLYQKIGWGMFGTKMAIIAAAGAYVGVETGSVSEAWELITEHLPFIKTASGWAGFAAGWVGYEMVGPKLFEFLAYDLPLAGSLVYNVQLEKHSDDVKKFLISEGLA